MLMNIVVSEGIYWVMMGLVVICIMGVIYLLVYDILANRDVDDKGERDDDDIDLWPS